VNEIRISGFGGQGIIRCGYIVGKTASLFDSKFATLTQSFGPEARGSACSAQIVVDDKPVRYPYVSVPDTVVAMSQEAYEKFGGDITDDGTLVIDEDLVKPTGPAKGGRLYAIPATRIAEQLGHRIVANIVMLGFFTAVTDIITAEAARQALPTSVPSRFVDLNVKAFEQGYEYGLAVLGKLPEGERSEKDAPAKTAVPATAREEAKRASGKAKKAGAAGERATGKTKKAGATARKKSTKTRAPGKRAPSAKTGAKRKTGKGGAKKTTARKR
jgi:2-oxoglutarate ferredoxin oxidoreductase subunit gamma